MARLIDADAFEREVMMMPDEELCEDYCYNVIAKLDDAPTVGGWVSVKDRLPDKPCGCLVFNIYGWRALDFWEGDGWAISDENEITHWMPLPPGPEDDK